MREMIIENVNVYTEKKIFERGSVCIRDGRFHAGTPCSQKEEVIDGGGCYAIPGLIDLHLHGCMGADFCDGTREAMTAIARYEAASGITAIAPATMTLPAEELEEILSLAAEYVQEMRERREEPDAGEGLADIVGVNMEGPFISPARKGAQNEKYILPCDAAICERFLKASRGLVKFIGIAPEENPESGAFIERFRDRVHVALAHTNADYETAALAFRAGADHVVHLYNGMAPFTHRAPGVVGAAMDQRHVWAELICDGIHIHPSAVRAAFRMFGGDRIVFVSDSMRAAGMADGDYILGGLKVQVSRGTARLAEGGSLAGSAVNLMDCVRRAVLEMGIPLETAVACATINPARRLGIEGEYGSISEGKTADLALLDRDLNLKMVVKRGRIV